MTKHQGMSIYEYGVFELNDNGEIICNISELLSVPIHIKEYQGNEEEGRCADTRCVLHLLNELTEKNKELKEENEQLKQRINSRLHFYRGLYESTNDKVVERVIEDLEDILKR